MSAHTLESICTTMNTHDFNSKTCLITGGASGIGASCVEAFLKEGAKFVAVLDIDEEKGRLLEESLNKKYPGKVLFIRCDVSDEESITKAFNDVVNKVEQLDIIVNNAGIMNDSKKFWRLSCEINLQGTISLSLKGVSHMRRDQGGVGGTIINVTSVSALALVSSVPVYCGTKAGVMHFSRCLAKEPFYSTTGVRVLTICFGATDTQILQDVQERVDPSIAEGMVDFVNNIKLQRPESAAAGCVAMYRSGENGSVWVSQNDEPAVDVTPTITQAYNIMASVVKII